MRRIGESGIAYIVPIVIISVVLGGILVYLNQDKLKVALNLGSAASANFSISKVEIDPALQFVDMPVNFNVDVTKSGSAAGSGGVFVSLYVNGKLISEKPTGNMNPGQIKTLTLSWQGAQVYGSKNVKITTGNVSKTFVVNILPYEASACSYMRGQRIKWSMRCANPNLGNNDPNDWRCQLTKRFENLLKNKCI
ncbi:MAG: hypothetical protein A2750_04165 [Candidatus Yanofskybacteria bacterium RIFCSPHIGHO2_01_FULL_45_42]|uniref:CARDB domain-containing protein n=3 Tax=Candidatus Yanofskyibacteriota TaxID=1752733 RepID=A0A1F8EZ44_9BACT|nr:MAG: hypothetical protein A2750_04165 [Candidatus Yanofskybacteria bacterium RIFCSPHIGHO2_01_FULL_45_42]OGN15419.1 MAG: hypothetical protein A3C81_01640 [Candidatus Yanofskybacteria bacterium RIFCSPHIGHO2_02_FULL_46_19]OGN28335.1 MAG: hypothetical protein A3B17_02905 [Candidatus Yanofskybacteria bacterium RIFCSPLOWO2_01_FULL_45_72]OGN32443.1 MAG: hypothetical protein A3J01_00030 [Candidatus Yanofskybacteria bacterium RIFCSPLOWO2_02_FULL_45_18]